MRAQRRSGLHIESVDLPASGWLGPIEAVRLGRSGELRYVTFAAPASSLVTEVDIYAWVGGDNDDETVTDPSDSSQVPLCNRIFKETGVAVVGSATTPDYEVSINPGYCYEVQTREGKVWFAIKVVTASDVQAGCEVAFSAKDVQ